MFFWAKKTNPTPDPPCPFSRIVWVLLFTNGNILDLLSIWTLPAELLTNPGPDHCDIGSGDWRFCDDWCPIITMDNEFKCLPVVFADAFGQVLKIFVRSHSSLSPI